MKTNNNNNNNNNIDTTKNLCAISFQDNSYLIKSSGAEFGVVVSYNGLVLKKQRRG
jgi:hypothetical protein